MRILITNDDGIMSEGIRILVEYLRDIAEVLVVAPDVERSATGHAITVRTPLWVKEIRIDGKFFGYAVNGTPADCVKIGVKAISKKALDMVISGINKGANLGTDIMYSGTVSAALEGALLKKPSIAISTTNFNEPMYKTAAIFARELVSKLALSDFPEYVALNVNVPSIPYSEIKGIKITKQGLRQYEDYFEARKDPYGNTYYWMLGNVVDREKAEDIDSKAVELGYISLTPLYILLTDEKSIDRFKYLEKS